MSSVFRRRRVRFGSLAAIAVAGSLVALASCARGGRSALLQAAPPRPVSIVRLAPVSVATTTTLPPVTTTEAPEPTTAAPAPPTTAVTEPPVTPPPTTAVPVPQAEPAPPLPAPLAPAGSGAKGDVVAALQQRLLDLGFWIDEADGQYGSVTVQAVMAFQKYYVDFGLKPSGKADQATVDALGAVTVKPFVPPDEPDAVVVDKGRQVLHLLRDGRTLWTLNTSTGSGRDYTEVDQKRGGTVSGHALTPEGTFKVYRDHTDGWESGELGQLYRPKYFAGGVAVHGSNSIPNYPASHGCVRISTTAMDWIWANDLMPRGAVVIVHA